ncbi:MAG: hypothetical protein L3K18_09525 [Thermoplasmata archaeon]|nr:hypothetical protein [Thermoplasmata archaeon]
MVESDYWTNLAGGVVSPGFVVYVPGGTNIPLYIYQKGYAGSGAILMLKGNTYGTTSEYTWDPVGGGVPAGTFIGGVTIMGPLPSTRQTYLGTPGSTTSAKQMTQAQLAGRMASIKVLSGPTTSQNYSAGSTGWGVDGLCFTDVFLHGETMTASNNLLVDTSANVTSRGAMFADFSGGLATYLLRFTDNGSVLGASGTNVIAQLPASTVNYTAPNDGVTRLYTIQGGTVSAISINGGASIGTSASNVSVGPGQTIAITYSVAPATFFWTYTVKMGLFALTYYTALNCPIHDYFNALHFYIGANGPVAINQGQYEDYFVSGGIQFNPSGLYSMDVGFDFEYGPTEGLRSFTADCVSGTNTKPVGYLSKSGKVRIGQIDHRITRGYGSAPGNLPSGAPYTLSSAGYVDPAGLPLLVSTDVEIGTINVIQEANSNPNYAVNGLIGLNSYSYLGSWHIGTLRAVVNLAGNGGPSGAGSALCRLMANETNLLPGLVAGGGATGPTYTFTTPNNGLTFYYILTGGTVSGITVAGSGVGTTLGQTIGPNVQVIVTYSVAPTLFQSSQAATTQFFDNFTIDRFFLGVTVAGNPSTAIPVMTVGNPTTAWTKTAGRFQVGQLIYTVGGPTAIKWTPVTTVAFVIPTEGTYTGSGGTISGYTANAETPVVASSFALHLQAGETITVTFTGSPTFSLYPGNGEPMTAGDGTHAIHSATIQLGITGCTMTLANEAILQVDASALAANALTAKRPAPLGTWTTTVRQVLAWAPADAHDTIADAVGTGTFTYKHGYDGAANNLVTKALPADNAGQVDVTGGTISVFAYNGAPMSTSAVAAGKTIWMEVGDILALTQTANPTAITIGSAKRLGS